MSMAVGMQDSGDSQWKWSGKASGMALRIIARQEGVCVGRLGPELCQEDLPPHKPLPWHLHHELERNHVSKST